LVGKIAEEKKRNKKKKKTGTLELERIEPESLGSKVVETLEMAFPSICGVLELLVAVVAVVLPQRHSLSLSLTLTI
jgi:hypothetical protein